MKAFEKVVVVIGFLIVVGAVVAIRIKMPGLETAPQPGPEPVRERVVPARPTVRPGRLPTRTERPKRPPTSPGSERPVPETGSRQDGVLATVNDEPLTEQQVFGPSGLTDEMMERAGAQSPRKMLNRAIDQELLRQYAVAQGLHQTEDHRERTEQREKRARRMEVNRLAAHYESTNKKLVSIRKSLKATAAEVDEYYAEHKQRYVRLSEVRAKQEIERMLSAQKYRPAYNRWLAGVLESVPLTVNDKKVPLKVLRKEMQAMAAGPAGTTTDGEMGDSTLTGYIRSVVGARDDSDRSTKRLLKAKIKVGPNTVSVGELFPAGIAGSPMLIPVLKGYIVAAKAVQEGVQLPEASRARARPPVDMDRGALARLAMKKEGLLSPNDLASEVTEAEIEAELAKNPRQYERLLKDAPKWAARAARGRIAQERLNQKKEDFIKDLRSDAKIEIVDERFMVRFM